MEKLKTLFIKYKEIILYLIVGGLTTVVSFVSFYIFNDLLQIQMEFANILSWVCAVLFAFFTNKIFVFESKEKDAKNTLKEFISFVTARLLTLLIDEGIMILGVRVLFMNEYITKLIAQVFVVVINYFLSKFIIFRKK